VNNSIHSSVPAKHLGFRKRDESFCADDDAERDGNYIAAKFCL